MTALGNYKLDTGTFPTTEQGLRRCASSPQDVNQWNGPYLPAGDPQRSLGPRLCLQVSRRARRRARHHLSGRRRPARRRRIECRHRQLEKPVTPWRRHSCLPRRDSSRRISPDFCEFAGTTWLCGEITAAFPHQYPEGKWLFVTCHLHGSLPQAKYPPPGKLSAGAAFVWIDRYLDTTRTGPSFCSGPDRWRDGLESLHRGVLLGQYALGAYVVMSNHLHMLLLPKISPSRLHAVAEGSHSQAGKPHLGANRGKFWQAESYDHWVRDQIEWNRIAAYIEDNPVKAGLVGPAPASFPGRAREKAPRRVSARQTRVSAPLRSRAQRGVTLMEMMVVMAIIGLITAISAPSITAGHRYHPHGDHL